MCSSFQMFLIFHRSHFQAGFMSRVLFICKWVLCYVYSKTCVKLPLKNRQNKDPNDKWQLNEGSKVLWNALLGPFCNIFNLKCIKR